MEVTCEKCHTKYRTRPNDFVGGGRMVRCSRCQHIWLYIAMPAAVSEEDEDIIPQHIQRHYPHASGGEDLPQEDDFATAARTFENMLAEREENEDNKDNRLPGPLSSRDDDMPVIDTMPAGMGASQFGLFTFLLLFFLTLIGLFVFRDMVVDRMPPMMAIYKPLGFDIHAPGEGLRFSDLTARQKDAGEGVAGTLELSMKLSNITEHPVSYPSLKVTLLGQYGAALKDWEFHPEDAKLLPGETIPVALSFEKIPDDGKTAEVRVIRR